MGEQGEMEVRQIGDEPKTGVRRQRCEARAVSDTGGKADEGPGSREERLMVQRERSQ